MNRVCVIVTLGENTLTSEDIKLNESKKWRLGYHCFEQCVGIKSGQACNGIDLTNIRLISKTYKNKMKT